MIGLVIVSHSARLAEGVSELAWQAAQGHVRIAAAGGTGDQTNPIGTDAFRVQQAIESVDDGDGVLVLMDLGSAILSAETALEFLDDGLRARVRLCPAPLVEGAVAAASVASAGGGIDEAAAEAERALSGKSTQLAPAPAPPTLEGDQRIVELRNPLGLHARPAARFIRLARGFDARLTVENLARPGAADGRSLNALLGLAARGGARLRLTAQGPQSREALTALAAFIDSGCGDRPEEAPGSAPKRPHAEGSLAGIPASAGFAVGPLARFRAAAAHTPTPHSGDPSTEWTRLDQTLAAIRDESPAASDPTGILEAQALFLEDPALIERARQAIYDDGLDAPSAWSVASEAAADELRAMDDPYLSARAADLRDAAGRVVRRLTGAASAGFQLSRPSIVAAYDLLPSEVEKLDTALTLGLCLESGSASAHSAILARARGIPAIAGLGPALAALREGSIVAMDGERGLIEPSPDAAARLDFERRREAWLASRQSALRDRSAPALTRDGHRVTILANLSRENEAPEALDYGAEGVGVLRTEFLYLNRPSAPTEQEQFAAYRAIATALGQRPLVIRTLDIGGDKGVPYIDIGAEANPFLGWRGVRVTLGRRDLFETQLSAILRAAEGHPVEVLLPMIATLDELREARSIVRALSGGRDIPVGVMIETPAAVAIAPELARESSRLSIGANDLVQYVMAADRTNSRVSPIADYFQPAVLRAIAAVAEAGREAGIPTDVCGEMAADPVAVPLLIGLGVGELSMSPRLIPEAKRAVRRCSLAEAKSLARAALQSGTVDDVRRLVEPVRPAPQV
ncbi:MAG: phosphoenolpyruvate--protein phosphotransferase [Acidobacteria bacterium]|nr:phosphoenolpyruvate--protein phosphotransferase [Acidobacteriota bacterium]